MFELGSAMTADKEVTEEPPNRNETVHLVLTAPQPVVETLAQD